jgi:hypothetical protein
MSDEYAVYAGLAKEGALPADFNQWDLVGNDGWTIAHESAMRGTIPASFSYWGALGGVRGWTVAHIAANHQNLPDDFNQWSIADKDGLTVLGHILRDLHTQSDKYMTRWEKERPLCRTEADWDTFKTELPDVYQKYSISEYMLDIDNDQRALQGASQRASQRALL